MAAPPPSPAARSTVAVELLERFRGLLGSDAVLASDDELMVYECDGYVVEKKAPDVVLLPTSTASSQEPAEGVTTKTPRCDRPPR